MNKIKIIGFFLLGSLILVACESSSNTSSPNKPTQTKQTENTQQATSEHSVDETSSFENLDIAMEKLITGDITEISGSDFIVGEDIEPGRYIIRPAENEPVQFKIHYSNGESQTYYLGVSTKELAAFKLSKSDRIELTVKRMILEAELLNDPLPNLAKGETAYTSGNDVAVGEDLPARQYTIKPIENEKVQFKIYHKDGNPQLYYLGKSTKNLKAFKLVDGDRIAITSKQNILEMTRTK
ncbi:hypothetical protein I583_02864 [Enterococcus haemoperoxidus ATCC BAA-382]|uniref:Lipoprotein n=3 Tax=Enterococcus haemoperoxidus ATCC BAA-382 TaxID=1158608 RepID=A0ABP2VIK5_9ENTE|nr:hypothetical protein [Enterococcus haemoperoxidus]EOT60229.1 hypothetical protein I583_02864 [Enterococcus haemoperoxidus ATCC BAA-382]